MYTMPIPFKVYLFPVNARDQLLNMAQHLSILYDGTGPHQLRLFEFLQKNLRPQLSEQEQVQTFFFFLSFLTLNEVLPH